ncbi:hypothetical protein OHS59_18110 [Streptomyces sp. NBC_00414]|uniref:hypothetical protein n=1 Tax=Streptomyces sp. NBC_00414 TaxID=2975739 RepID=UPI002E1EB86E
MTRGTAGRRALQVVLLVGGLFGLGLLCGEQAHAADGLVPAKKPTEVVRSVTSSAEGPAAGTQRDRTGEQSPDAKPRSVTDEVRRVVRPVTESLVRPVAERVVQPVGDLVDQITDGTGDGLGDGPAGGIGEQPAPPQWWPSLPQLPTLPGAPELPGLPLPLPVVPGETLPAGTAAPQQPGGTTDEQQQAPDERQTAGKQSRGESVAVYGPRVAVVPAAAGEDVRHRGHAGNTRATGVGQAPVHQVPDGDPTGASGRHLGVDNGSPRHGDAQAVTLNERARPTLVPGAAADVTAAGPRDRHRDIPAFPG